MDCIFCKIAKGEIPCSKVYEDHTILAFLDIMPVNQGHTLVIPKKHYENVFDIPQEAWQHQMEVVRKLAPSVKSATQAEGISITMSNNKAAGQAVFHAHVHIIPRYSDDGLKLWPQKKYEEGIAEKLALSIRSALSSFHS